MLNTGRIRDQWHTMTRTGRSPRLAAHLPEPFVDMHAADALRFGLARDGALVRVVTRWGRMVARLRTSGEIARGSIFVPIHWSGPNASDARVGALVGPAVDPISGEPEFKNTPARVEPFVVNWYGFALTRGSLSRCRASAGGPAPKAVDFVDMRSPGGACRAIGRLGRDRCWAPIGRRTGSNTSTPARALIAPCIFWMSAWNLRVHQLHARTAGFAFVARGLFGRNGSCPWSARTCCRDDPQILRRTVARRSARVSMRGPQCDEVGNRRGLPRFVPRSAVASKRARIAVDAYRDKG